MTRCSARRITHRGSHVQPDDHICDSYREFECGYCGREIRICRCCDDGQLYCPDGECASRARELKVPGYRANYEQTRKGKKAHAKRQMRYRNRRELALIVGMQVVTDHPSTFSPSSSTVPRIENEEFEDDEAPIESSSTQTELGFEHRSPPICSTSAELVRCDVCGRFCRPFVHRWSSA